MNNLSDKNILIENINLLKRNKKAVILSHYYVDSDIQDIADFVGDSLALSQAVTKTDAEIIVFAGVHFMAETAKILSPEKKVLLPDINSGCSLADSCPEQNFSEFIKQYPESVVVSYVNTTAAVKALTDIVCTSSNALQIVESIPTDKTIIFAPDRNLGNYISSKSGRKLIIWDGACHVHSQFSLGGILELKNNNPKAKIISHPECPKPVLTVSDFIGSTKALIDFSVSDNADTYIVATEPGVLHQMKIKNPNKEFIPAPSDSGECACNECEFMKLNSLQKIYSCLLSENNEILLDEELIIKARKSIINMLDISAKYGL